MSSPTFPLVTLAAKVTAQGITQPAFSDILNSLIASFQAIYGSDAILTPDTQDYQLLAIFANAINDANTTLVAIYNGFIPAFAQGVGLSSLVKINGLARLVPTNSTAILNIVGTVGTVINNGVAQDTNGNLWNLPQQVIIPGGGLIAVTATAQVQGAIAAAANTITTIFSPTLGWQSVTNPSPATIGSPVETDAALRIRQQISTSLPASTPLSAIQAAIANLPGVVRSFVYENPTGSADSNGVPAHSIQAVVQGGVLTQIAQTIEAKKSPGTGTGGGTQLIVNDPSGVPVAINFDVLSFVTVFVSLTVKQIANYVSSTTTAIINALVAYINALPIGAQVYYNDLIAVATLVNSNAALALSFHVTVLTSGTAANPTGTVDIPVAFNKAAQTVAANIVVTVT